MYDTTFWSIWLWLCFLIIHFSMFANHSPPAPPHVCSFNAIHLFTDVSIFSCSFFFFLFLFPSFFFFPPNCKDQLGEAPSGPPRSPRLRLHLCLVREKLLGNERLKLHIGHSFVWVCVCRAWCVVFIVLTFPFAVPWRTRLSWSSWWRGRARTSIHPIATKHRSRGNFSFAPQSILLKPQWGTLTRVAGAVEKLQLTLKRTISIRFFTFNPKPIKLFFFFFFLVFFFFFFLRPLIFSPSFLCPDTPQSGWWTPRWSTLLSLLLLRERSARWGRERNFFSFANIKNNLFNSQSVLC